LILDECWLGRLLQRHGDACDGVVVRAALEPGKYGVVDRTLEIVFDRGLAVGGRGFDTAPVEDDPCPGPPGRDCFGLTVLFGKVYSFGKQQQEQKQPHNAKPLVGSFKNDKSCT